MKNLVIFDFFEGEIKIEPLDENYSSTDEAIDKAIDLYNTNDIDYMAATDDMIKRAVSRFSEKVAIVTHTIALSLNGIIDTDTAKSFLDIDKAREYYKKLLDKLDTSCMIADKIEEYIEYLQGIVDEAGNEIVVITSKIEG